MGEIYEHCSIVKRQVPLYKSTVAYTFNGTIEGLTFVLFAIFLAGVSPYIDSVTLLCIGIGGWLLAAL